MKEREREREREREQKTLDCFYVGKKGGWGFSAVE